MIEDKRTTAKHTVVLDKRRSATITGVIDVVSFDDETIIAETEMGMLILKGINLHVNKLNLENGELSVDGEFISLLYEEQSGFPKGKSSFFGRLFK